MQTVYIWSMDSPTGHASLHVQEDRIDEYLSYHPKEISDILGSIFLSVAARSLSGGVEQRELRGPRGDFEADMKKYKYWDEKIELRYLDSHLMSEMIVELHNKENHHNYNLATSNCSTTVANCLLIGFAKLAHDCDLSEHLALNLQRSGFARALRHLPDHVHSKIGEILFYQLPSEFVKFGALSAVRNRVAAARFLVGVAGALKGLHYEVWSPDDVCQLAKFIEGIEMRLEQRR